MPGNRNVWQKLQFYIEEDILCEDEFTLIFKYCFNAVNRWQVCGFGKILFCF